MKIKKVCFETFLLGIILISEDLSSVISEFKYLKYSGIFLFLIYMVQNPRRKIRIEKSILNLFFSFTFLVIISLLRIESWNLKTIYNVTFWSASILPFFVLDPKKININQLFNICMITFITLNIFNFQ